MIRKTFIESNILCFFAFFIIFASCKKGDTIDLKDKVVLENVIESEFKKCNTPGMAYIAVKGDSMLFKGAKGYANYEAKKNFTTTTRMVIASITKTLAGTSIMQLHEQGKLDINLDINRYLPYSIINPNFPSDSITIKMLLTHTSSISDDGYSVGKFYLFDYSDYPITLKDFMKEYLLSNGQFYTNKSFSKNKPGNNYSYSNVGVGLLGTIVEYVSGMDYNTYCKTNIFQPLGMINSTFFYNETPRDEVAIIYSDLNNLNPKNPFFTYPTYPDGHLITTVEDLSKFLRAFIMNGKFNNYQLLKENSVQLMLQLHIPSINKYQGLIFNQLTAGNTKVWGHNGSDPGVFTEMYFDPVTHAGAIVFFNRSMLIRDGETTIVFNSLLKHAQQ